MAKKAAKKIEWRDGETYNQARTRWWNSMTLEEKKDFFKRASVRGAKLQEQVKASRRKSAA